MMMQNEEKRICSYREIEDICSTYDICIWGYGKVGKSYAYMLLKAAGARISCFCDNKYREGEYFRGIHLINKEELFKESNNGRNNKYVFVAIEDKDSQKQVIRELCLHGINASVLDILTYSNICNSLDNEKDFQVIEKYKMLIDDKLYLKELFRQRIGTELDLKHPSTFNEKIQYLKIYDRNSLYTTLVDKAAAKSYVAEKIGDRYIIPTLAVWDNAEDIDLDILPDRFVLKCTHDSGSTIICKDKALFDIRSARDKLTYSLLKNSYWTGREWPYKNVNPHIIAEEYMEDQNTRELRDYKFFVFNGIVKLMFVATGRQSKNETCFDFFDRDYQHLDILNGHPNSRQIPEKPQKYKEMIDIAEQLSIGIPQVRIDLYEVNGRIYFGEFTFSHYSGFVPFNPSKWDYQLGELIDISNIE